MRIIIHLQNVKQNMVSVIYKFNLFFGFISVYLCLDPCPLLFKIASNTCKQWLPTFVCNILSYECRFYRVLSIHPKFISCSLRIDFISSFCIDFITLFLLSVTCYPFPNKQKIPRHTFLTTKLIYGQISLVFFFFTTTALVLVLDFYY